MSGGIVRRTPSTDETCHVITYVRNHSSMTGVRPMFTARIVRYGVFPTDAVEPSSSEDHALHIRTELADQCLTVYEVAPCLMDGAP